MLGLSSKGMPPPQDRIEKLTELVIAALIASHEPKLTVVVL
jgi:hypothetical protein